MPERELDELESYLASADVLEVASFSQTTAHHSHRLILEGGVAVIAKPADTAPEGPVMCHREAAAWMLARELGWWDLLSATVMRSMISPASGVEVETSAQIIWPDYLPDADTAVFKEDDVWRAALFDVLVVHTDRGGHNWLAVPGSGPEPRLKLVDHGYAFGTSATASPSSTFYEMSKGSEIPDGHRERVAVLVQRRDELPRLRGLLGADAVDAIIARAEAIVDMSVLEITSS